MIPVADQNRHFWSDIRDQTVILRENTDWLRKVKNEMEELTVQDDIHNVIKKVSKNAELEKSKT